MAIVKTTFTSVTQSANAPEVLAWLQANATAYFDTIEADANGNIHCKIENKTVILIGMDGGNTKTTFFLANDNYIYNDAVTGDTFFSAAIKTTKGIRLVSNSPNYFGDIFISKSDIGGTCIATFSKGAGGINSYGYIFADFVHSPNFYAPYTTSSPGDAKALLTYSSTNTSLTHVTFDGGFYAPDLYIATFSQYANIPCNFSINNKKYTSDGVIALAE